jgi:hypothetical protein
MTTAPRLVGSSLRGSVGHPARFWVSRCWGTPISWSKSRRSRSSTQPLRTYGRLNTYAAAKTTTTAITPITIIVAIHVATPSAATMIAPAAAVTAVPVADCRIPRLARRAGTTAKKPIQTVCTRASVVAKPATTPGTSAPSDGRTEQQRRPVDREERPCAVAARRSRQFRVITLRSDRCRARLSPRQRARAGWAPRSVPALLS